MKNVNKDLSKIGRNLSAQEKELEGKTKLFVSFVGGHKITRETIFGSDILFVEKMPDDIGPIRAVETLLKQKYSLFSISLLNIKDFGKYGNQ